MVLAKRVAEECLVRNQWKERSCEGSIEVPLWGNQVGGYGNGLGRRAYSWRQSVGGWVGDFRGERKLERGITFEM